MYEFIFILETRSSKKTDWMYIKSTIDYYYKPRSFGIKKIFARTKSELIKQDFKIEELIKEASRKPIVIICADFDRVEVINDRILKYCNSYSYELIWMNLDVEDVYLGKQIKDKNKGEEAINFLKRKDYIISKLDNLSEINPLEGRHKSNILVILDKYLERKEIED